MLSAIALRQRATVSVSKELCLRGQLVRIRDRCTSAGGHIESPELFRMTTELYLTGCTHDVHRKAMLF